MLSTSDKPSNNADYDLKPLSHFTELSSLFYGFHNEAITLFKQWENLNWIKFLDAIKFSIRLYDQTQNLDIQCKVKGN